MTPCCAVADCGNPECRTCAAGRLPQPTNHDTDRKKNDRAELKDSTPKPNRAELEMELADD